MLLGKRFIFSAKARAAYLGVLPEQLSRALAAAFGAAADVENCRPRQPARMHEPGALPAPAVLQMDHSQAPNALPVFRGLAAPAVCHVGWKKDTDNETAATKLPQGCDTGPGAVLGAGKRPSGANLFPARPSPRAGLRVVSRAEQRARHQTTPESPQ